MGKRAGKAQYNKLLSFMKQASQYYKHFSLYCIRSELIVSHTDAMTHHYHHGHFRYLLI